MIKRVLILFFITLIALGGLALWQKGKIRQRFWPVKAVSPISQPSSVYDLMTLLGKSGLRISQTPVIVDGTIQASVSGVSVLFAPDKDLAVQVRSLQLVLPRLTMEGKKVLEIDLRFNKVVVRY